MNRTPLAHRRCDRSATYVRTLGRGAACPPDAIHVVLHKLNGEHPATLCSEHIRGYERAGVKVTPTFVYPVNR